MTDKSRLVVIIVIALAIILAVTAFAYSKHAKRQKEIADNASGGPHIVTVTQDRTDGE